MSSGFHRRIMVRPSPGRIMAALEDNLHRFDMELSHADGVVTDLLSRTIRYPWTTCADAPAFLREQAIGRRLEELSGLDCYSHCTHLFELAVLCAGHAEERAPVRFGLHVDDWRDNRTRVRLSVDGRLSLDLEVEGWEVTTPGAWFGRDLLRTALWSSDLSPAECEQAMLVSRAIYVSLGRAAPVVQRATERGESVLGVCFSYQPSRVGDAIQGAHSRREFGGGTDEPLQDFLP